MSCRNKKNSRKKIRSSAMLAIDGHNVCYQCPDIAAAMHRDMEEGRRLFEQSTLRQNNRNWHIFYDGGPGGLQRRQNAQTLSLHYSGSERNADDCLIEWLHYQQTIITVVSNDRELCMRAEALGAITISAQNFLDYIDTADPLPAIDENPPSQTEVDFWTDQFS